MLEKLERRGIQPLQIVEEQSERMLRPRKYAEKPLENHLEPVLRIPQREVRNGRLLPDDELDLGDEIDDKLAVRAYRILQRAPPPAHLRFALGKDLPDEGP